MAIPTPRHCRPEAWDALQAALPDLDHTRGLVACAVAVSRHHLPDANPAAAERALDDLAAAAAEPLQSDRPAAVLAHLHAVLFDEARFTGPAEDYHHPDHSLLPRVLETRRGLPLTLVLVYKAVAERLGLRVSGVNAPGHFLAGVHGADAPSGDPHHARSDGSAPRTLIDPFHGGRLLTRDDAFGLIERVAGVAVEAAVAHDDALLPTATHRQWLARLIQNLVTAADRRGHSDDLAAMLELRALVRSGPGGGS